jgi:SAM-dependent methyltransferase
MTYNYLTSCLACGGKELEQYLDLGHQVFANSYPKEYRVDSVLPSAPLQINFCHNCKHSQLSVAANPEELFSDYLYVSGTTQTLKDHFRSLVTASLPLKPVDKISVLDIGANDYSLLREFQNRGVKVEGVDPAQTLAHLAGNIPAVVDFWGREAALKVSQAPYDLITGLNVFAHNLDPLGFLEACKLVLKEDGKILLEMPWFKETLARRSVGQIYHEHINYFTVTSMLALVERSGLVISDLLEFPDIHDGTIRFVLSRGKTHTPTLRYYLLAELLIGLGNIETYRDFGELVKGNIRQLESLLVNFKNKGARIVAYGASAKLSTILGVFSSSKYPIDYIVDDNELKVGRHQTDTEIPILPTSSLNVDHGGLVIFITPDNFFREIKDRLTKAGVKCTLVRYVPTVEIEEI